MSFNLDKDNNDGIGCYYYSKSIKSIRHSNNAYLKDIFSFLFCYLAFFYVHDNFSLFLWKSVYETFFSCYCVLSCSFQGLLR